MAYDTNTTKRAARAFTNVPNRIGDEAEPGVFYENLPIPSADDSMSQADFDSGLRGSIRKEAEAGIVAEYGQDTVDRARKSLDSAPQSILEKPPESQIPDYSAAGRDKFLGILKQQIGFDPTSYDPYTELAKAEKEHLPAIFRNFFKGKILYDDRERLNANQKKEWDTEHMKFRAHVFNRAQQLKTMGDAAMKEGLTSFDNKAKEHNAMVKDVEKRIDAEKAAMRKAPTTKDMSPAGGGPATVHEWRNGQWVDTGRPSLQGKMSKAQELRQLDFENEILAEYDSGQQIDPADLALINEKRYVLGLPDLVEIEEDGSTENKFGDTAGGIKGWFGIGSREGTVYRYVDADTVEDKTETAEKGEVDIQAEYPNAYKAADGKWYYTDDTGQAFLLEVE